MGDAKKFILTVENKYRFEWTEYPYMFYLLGMLGCKDRDIEMTGNGVYNIRVSPHRPGCEEILEGYGTIEGVRDES